MNRVAFSGHWEANFKHQEKLERKTDIFRIHCLQQNILFFLFIPTYTWDHRRLVLHSNQATETFTFQHKIKGLVNLREFYFMSDEFLHFKFLQTNTHTKPSVRSQPQHKSIKRIISNRIEFSGFCFLAFVWLYPSHVFLDNGRKIRSRFVISEESSLQCSLVQQVHRMCFEFGIFVRYANEDSNSPSLKFFQNQIS